VAAGMEMAQRVALAATADWAERLEVSVDVAASTEDAGRTVGAVVAAVAVEDSVERVVGAKEKA
jgi:hypothetical protein